MAAVLYVKYADAKRRLWRRAVEGASEQPIMRAPKRIISSARHLRRTLSSPEVQLWNRLRTRRPGQPVFRRQHPIGPYVLNFYCAKAHLAIEIDGLSHERIKP
jgi:very-short-patch-repair endonuclease